MALDLRPLTLPELLDRAFGLYRRHLWLFIGIMAVPSAFAVALNVMVESMKYVTGANAAVAPGTVPDSAQMALVGLAFGLGMMVVLAAYLIVYMVALGATTLAVSEIYLDRGATIPEVYSRMRRSVWPLLRLLIVMGVRGVSVFVGGVLLAGMLGGVVSEALGSPVWLMLIMSVGMAVSFVLLGFMTIRWGVAVPAMVLEDLGARASIRRSIELTRGRRWRVLLLAVCATMITYAVMALSQGPFLIGAAVVGPETRTGFGLALVGTVLGAIATSFTGPIMIIGLALLYYDARIRDEGLDLQLMMAAMDEPAAAIEPARG